MKIAFIPPYAHAMSMRHTDYQLILPRQTENAKYEHAVRKMRRRGDYIMLDNGMAEGDMFHWDDLYEVAKEFMVNEIVLPDVQGDSEATRALVKDVSTEVDTRRFNYMAVVQGSTISECYDLIRWYAYNAPWVKTLGIPRHLITTLSEHELPQDYARVALVNFIRTIEAPEPKRFDIHLLGMNPASPRELVAYGREYRHQRVRGCDTSQPFNAALEDAFVQEMGYCPRRDGYFDMTIPITNRYIYPNLVMMMQWVKDDLDAG